MDHGSGQKQLQGMMNHHDIKLENEMMYQQQMHTNAIQGQPSPENDDDDDAEGVWSADIEQCFQEALQLYPPCGRRKIILSEEGKMYGRNELIARYIKHRTGKQRSRKQVSSHIQVLARRKMREVQVGIKTGPLDPVKKESILQSLANMSSAQIVSAAASAKQQPGFQGTVPNINLDAYTLSKIISSNGQIRLTHFDCAVEPNSTDGNQNVIYDAGKKHTICKMVPAESSPNPTAAIEEISMSLVSDKFPKNNFQDNKGPLGGYYLLKFFANIDYDLTEDEQNAVFAVTQQFESLANVTLQINTQVISFAKPTVEKIEVEYAKFDEASSRWISRIEKSPVCDYMRNFIFKLKRLPEKSMVNTVLDNFTILQRVTNRDTDELLFVLAYVFEAVDGGDAVSTVYKLVSSSSD